MKCNKCYQKIPSGEEMWKRERGYFHEKCLTEINQQDRKIIFRFGIGLTLLALGLTLACLFDAFKSRKKITKKRCHYCEKVCNNACKAIKRSRKTDLELAKIFFLVGLVVLLTFTVYQITSSFWSILILPVLLLVIHRQTKSKEEDKETI